jgi:hypothetical protein
LEPAVFRYGVAVEPHGPCYSSMRQWPNGNKKERVLAGPPSTADHRNDDRYETDNDCYMRLSGRFCKAGNQG